MNTNEKIKLIRDAMEKYEIDAYVIPSSDPHQSEYLPENYKLRQWVTGFTGSNGLAVITKEDAKLWTDGRYFIQAEAQISDSEFKLMKIDTPGYPNYIDWMYEMLPEKSSIGFDGVLVSQNEYEVINEKMMDKSIVILDSLDLVSNIWSDRPEAGKDLAFLLDVKYAGKSASEKLSEVREHMKQNGIENLLLTSLEDICWLYNIRGNDILNTPVLVSYGIVTDEYAFLFTDLKKITLETQEELAKNGVDIEEYGAIFGFVNGIRDSVISLDKSKVNRKIYKSIDKSNKIVDEVNITTNMKAIKNETEMANIKETHIKDGAALTKFMYWLKNYEDKTELDEIIAEQKLEEFRREQELFITPSFDTISAYGPNAAMMHYRAVEDNYSKLENRGLYLVDSGGQYYGGTTDITRTFALGELTDEEMTDFTLVLKGHINLGSAVFLEGASGQSLDALSRAPIWKHRMDYKSGTGHGVGFVLGVHEGPHRIAPKGLPVELLPGMLVSNEPGIYKEGKHGIRSENLVFVVDDEKNGDGQFRRFEVVSFAPFDVDAIKVEMLNEDEKQYLNDYHEEVYNKVNHLLNEEEKEWLYKVTRAI